MHRPPAAGRITANWIILIAALAAGLGLWLGMRAFAPPPVPAVTLQGGMLFPHPRAVPDFTLQLADGATLSRVDLSGRWSIVFFGYTHCPDVCPTTLASFAQAWKKLEPPLRERLRFVFVSVDPQRDTPELLARYVTYFNKDFIGATGSDQVLQGLTRALGLVYAVGKAADGNYTVDHSATVVIIDPHGREVGLLRPPFEVAGLVADLQALARSSR